MCLGQVSIHLSVERSWIIEDLSLKVYFPFIREIP